MLNELSIQGFRCFDHFEIKDFRRLNLISGKNSTGKSTLLEAIQLFVQPDSDTLAELLAWRGQLAPPRDFPAWSEDLVRPLFHGLDSNRHFEIFDGHALLLARLAFYHRDNGKLEEIPGDVPGPPRTVGLCVELRVPESPLFILPLDGSLDVRPAAIRNPQAFVRYASLDKRRIVHVRPPAIQPESLAEMLEVVLGTTRQDDLTRVLQWMIPDILSVFTKGAGGDRNVFIQTRRFSRPQPLAVFGEGAVRLAFVCLAIILAKGGFCLIDEIENGIHHSLTHDLWAMLDRLSKELNVQVFATTHSKDCLEAFEEMAANPDFDAAFYRLERNEQNSIEAVRLDYANYFSRVEACLTKCDDRHPETPRSCRGRR